MQGLRSSLLQPQVVPNVAKLSEEGLFLEYLFQQRHSSKLRAAEKPEMQKKRNFRQERDAPCQRDWSYFLYLSLERESYHLHGLFLNPWKCGLPWGCRKAVTLQGNKQQCYNLDDLFWLSEKSKLSEISALHLHYGAIPRNMGLGCCKYSSNGHSASSNLVIMC